MPQPKPSPAPAWETPFTIALLLAALGLFGWAVARGWSAGDLPGNEFRQTQTALSAYFIDRDNNFSPAYPTPVLGKPWSVPMEFPLYQWSVVGLARLTGLPLVQAARAVSVACLLLALPALAGLLRRLELPAAPRRYTLALVLLCPLHLFYARAFLIETMALMFALWFLHAFVETLHRRRVGWFLLAVAAGTAAGLVKVTTLFVYLLPAAVWGAVLLGRSWRERATTGPRPGAILAWGLGVAAPVLAVAWGWVAYADAVKRLNPAADFLLSGNLTGFNFGHGVFGERFSASVWAALLRTWDHGLLPWPAIVALLLAALLFGGRWRRPALAAAALFLVVQVALPNLYSFHDYYFVAVATLLAVAAGFALAGLRESRLPCWIAPAAALLCLSGQFLAYARHYCPAQVPGAPGGSGLTDSLRALTPRNSILIVAGADWSSSIPYFAQRRSLLLRRGQENNAELLDRALARLEGEELGALVLVGEQRGNRELVARVAGRFDLDPQVAYSHTTAEVYVGNAYRETVLNWLNLPHGYDQITTTRKPAAHAGAAATPPTELAPQTARTLFEMVSPAPTRMRATFGFPVLEFEGGRVLNTHPDCDLWVPPPATATRIEWEFGILPGAYQGTEGRTNGVEFIIDAEQPDGAAREIFRRVLTPAGTATDRGVQTATVPYAPRPGETLVFRTRPNRHPAFDWAFWRRIDVK